MAQEDATQEDESFEALLEHLRDSRAFDFTGYKRPSLKRRVAKRMEDVGISDYALYLDYLQVHPTEFTQLFNAILINFTGFFRDTAIWDYLGGTVIPRIVEGKKPDDPIRVWCAGVATGEEAYSVVMLIAEALGTEVAVERTKVYGTDVDEEALVSARQATYTARTIEPIPPELVERYFEPVGDKYMLNRDLRRVVILGRHDLVQDAPISKVDLLVCRNTLMYFNSETQSRILRSFHFALNEGGFLLLGKAEMLFTSLRSFQPVDLRRRVFTKVSAEADLKDQLLLAAQAGNDDTVGRLTNHARGREAAYDSAPVAQILVDRKGYLVLANLKARMMFGLQEWDVGRPFSELELSYRPAELRSTIEEVYLRRTSVQIHDVAWISPAGLTVHLDIDIVPLGERMGGLLGVGISFVDVTRFLELQQELEHSSQELETAMEELQSTNEELETTNEELQSTNEELETTNEELQSTNEELETMNEELHSANEELQAVNEGIGERTTALDGLNSYLESILRSIRAAVIVVDRDLRVRLWNQRAEDIWGLRSEDVAGRHLRGLDISLPVEELAQKVADVLAGSDTFSEMTIDARDRWDRALRVRVSGSPFRAPDGSPSCILLIEPEGAEAS